MKNFQTQFKTYLIFIVLGFMFSCVKDNFDLKEKFSDEFKWNPSIALPIAHADLTLANLVKEKQDTIQYISENDLGYGTQDTDFVIQLRYGIDSARNIDIMRLPIMEPYDTTIYLDPIKLNDVTTAFNTTVNDLLNDNFSATDYSDYQAYEAGPQPAANVTSRTAIQSVMYNSPSLPFQVIDYALLSEGEMEVICNNNFTVPFMADIAIFTDSVGTQIPIATFEFSNGGTQWIAPGSSSTRTYTFDSTYLGSQLYYRYENMRFDNALNVPIDLTDRIVTQINLTDLVATEGRAIIPQQTLEVDSTIFITIRDKDASKKLYRIIVEEGLIHYRITSSVDAAIKFGVVFNTMMLDGDTVTKEAILNDSNPLTESDWTLTNHEVDLTTNPEQPYNSLPITLNYTLATEEGSTEMFEFGPDQNINIRITNPDSIFFRYLEGNMGQGEEDVFTDTLSFDIERFLKNFLSGEITFYDPKLRIVYDNPVGIPGKFQLNLKGTNPDGEIVDVFAGHDNTFNIAAPGCDSVEQGLGIVSEIELNKNTSNIVDFIRILPNSIEYSGKYLINADAPDPNAILNCVSNIGDAHLTIEAELPMKLSVNDLILQQDVDLSKIPNLDSIQNIQSLRLFIYTENQFPLDVNLKVIMLDTTLVGNQELGVLDMVVLESATTVGGKVARGISNKHTEEITLTSTTDDRLENFLQANKLRIQLLIETDQQGNIPVIFYTYYGLKFNLAVDGKFLYEGRLSDF